MYQTTHSQSPLHDATFDQISGDFFIVFFERGAKNVADKSVIENLVTLENTEENSPFGTNLLFGLF